jgi:hypothetical protein
MPLATNAVSCELIWTSGWGSEDLGSCILKIRYQLEISD